MSSERRRWLVSAVVVTVACGAGGFSPILRPAGAELASNVSAVCGTWALQQASNVSELKRLRPKIDEALGFHDVRGFSLRYPWTSAETDLALLEEGQRVAAASDRAFSFRFMAGRHTPGRLFEAGAHFFVSSSGERIPKPFSDSGTAGNLVFEQAYDAYVAKTAAWARANGVRELHLPWYGMLWAEIYNGEEIQAAAGYSAAAWLEGHKRLIDIAARYAGEDLAVEFPLSGYWGGNNRLAGELVGHMVARLGTSSGKVFVQSNGLGVYNGAPASRGVFHGMQMYDGADYDWSTVYGHLYANRSVYVEVYVSSFAGANRAGLQIEITKFSVSGDCLGAGAAAVPNAGYRLVADDGGIFAFGDAPFLGSTGARRLASPVVGMAATPSGAGYWLVADDGGIFAFGDAPFLGSTGALRLASPVAGMAATPSGAGYWLVADDGGIFAFGDAPFLGSTGARRLASPVVGMAATPSGAGYWLVAADGGIFAFGDAPFLGSTGALRLASPVVGMAATPSGAGYWLVAADGGIFAFGDAPFLGSTGALRLSRPVVGMAATPSGAGYWLVAADGGIFAFGNAPFLGSTGALALAKPIVGASTR